MAPGRPSRHGAQATDSPSRPPGEVSVSPASSSANGSGSSCASGPASSSLSMFSNVDGTVDPILDGAPEAAAAADPNPTSGMQAPLGSHPATARRSRRSHPLYKFDFTGKPGSYAEAAPVARSAAHQIPDVDCRELRSRPRTVAAGNEKIQLAATDHPRRAVVWLRTRATSRRRVKRAVSKAGWWPMCLFCRKRPSLSGTLGPLHSITWISMCRRPPTVNNISRAAERTTLRGGKYLVR